MKFAAAERDLFTVQSSESSMETEMLTKIQCIIEREASLRIPAACLTLRANLYDLGLTSFDAIRLLVAVECAFKVEFPREMLTRRSAASIEAIVMALHAIQPSLVMSEEMRAAA